jgi:predicted O-linked N-acetylglucosamine transferase (SPINDLY family)
MVNLAELLQLAVARHRAGEWDQAEQAYRQVLERAPGESGVRHDLAWLLYQRGRHGEAIEQLNSAIATRPNQALFHSHLGVMLRGAGKPEEAIGHFQTALRLVPSNFEAHYNLGNAYQQLARFELAAESYRSALLGAPDDPDIHLNLGVALKELGQLDAARRSFERALAIKPDFADAWVNLGIVCKVEANYSEAVACYQRALEINPQNALAYNNMGSALQAQDQLVSAIACYEKALGLNPRYATAYSNLAEAYHAQGNTSQAVACFGESLRLGASDALKIKAALVLPVILESVQQISDVRERLGQHLDRLADEKLAIRDPVLSVGLPAFYLAYQGRNERRFQSQIAHILRRATPLLEYVAPHCLTAEGAGRKRRIKVGFISQHFYAHTIGKLNAGLIHKLDRDRFEVVVFRLPGHDDGMAQFISQGADACLAVSPQFVPARRQIAEQQLDVLFFPDIGMDALTYYLAHARLAPVQCVTWGHPLTTGIPTIDYFISSRDLEPDEADSHYTERLVRLPHLTNYYYKPTPPRHAKTRQEFGFDPAAHLYVCPQSLFKLHPDNDLVFGDILRQDPLARIVLIEGKQPAWAALLRQRQQKALGSRADRIQLIPFQPLTDFRQLLALADVILDPLHFGGGDTSYEAFAVGAPIVTLPGGFLRSRITYALYRAMGLSDCIATDADDYAARAVRLGTDADWRSHVRSRILAANGALYENPSSVAELEAFLAEAVAAR